MALSSRRLPSLLRVPASPVPRSQQYYEGATTSRARLNGRLFVSLPLPTATSFFVSASALPQARRHACRPGPLFSGYPSFRLLSRGRAWDLSGLQAIHPVSLLRSRTPVEPTCPRHNGHVDAAPATRTAKASAILHFGANPQLWHLLSYASRYHCCHAQGWLPAGWLAFAGRESNPLDRYGRFQLVFMTILLPCSPDATGSAVHRANARCTASGTRISQL
jgi:hypothetical protein